MRSITPVILAGGSGTRLWPLSRKAFPKQFSKLLNHKSLFQSSILRLKDAQKVILNENIILTNSDYRFVVLEQLLSIGVDQGTIILEPESKNTAAAILSASLHASKKDKEAIILVMPSDHLISNNKKFNEIVIRGLEEVLKGKIVTFGVKPTYAETGYGYLELKTSNLKLTQDLVRFVEKPNKAEAKKMVKTGKYLWNSGIFLFAAKDIIKAFKKYKPDLLSSTILSLNNAKLDLDFIRLDKASWSSCENISIDFAIMEKADNLSVVPFLSRWTDLGNWNAVWKEMKTNSKGVSLSTNAYELDCSDTLLRSEDKDQKIFGLGLKNIIAIATPDAVLVANQNKTHEVKKAVNLLKGKNISQAEFFPKDHRPWGHYEILTVSEGFQVKRIFVKPGASLSLQSHNHRSEHWVVVEGIAEVTIDNVLKTLEIGESTYIPVGVIHKLANKGPKPLIIIEVQTGSYLGEDDIIRYEDKYGRK